VVNLIVDIGGEEKVSKFFGKMNKKRVVVEEKDAKKGPKNENSNNNSNNDDNRIEENRIGVIAAQIVTTTELFS
jgi:hypothetical protein